MAVENGNGLNVGQNRIIANFFSQKVNLMTRRNNRLGKLALILSSIGWGIGTTMGLALLFNYQTLPGADGNPIKHLSESRSNGAVEDRLLFVMAVHPHCPCTRSSLEALARIVSRSNNQAIARVLFVKPNGAGAKWEQSDLWNYASSIPGVEVVCDDEGVQSTRLGLKTSGHVLMFDRDGRRIFSGGITAGRGHHGDNNGLDQCLGFLAGQSSIRNDTPVFGCSLLTLADCEVEGAEPCR